MKAAIYCRVSTDDQEREGFTKEIADAFYQYVTNKPLIAFLRRTRTYFDFSKSELIQEVFSRGNMWVDISESPNGRAHN